MSGYALYFKAPERFGRQVNSPIGAFAMVDSMTNGRRAVSLDSDVHSAGCAGSRLISGVGGLLIRDGLRTPGLQDHVLQGYLTDDFGHAETRDRAGGGSRRELGGGCGELGGTESVLRAPDPKTLSGYLQPRRISLGFDEDITLQDVIELIEMLGDSSAEREEQERMIRSQRLRLSRLLSRNNSSQGRPGLDKEGFILLAGPLLGVQLPALQEQSMVPDPDRLNSMHSFNIAKKSLISTFFS
ncbi:unnamed protein product, partial [Polarella glacialis]